MQKRGTGRRHNSADNLTFTKGDDLSSARRRPESSSSKSFSTTRGLRGATKAHPHFLQIVGCILVVGIVLGGILWVVHHPKAPAETAVSSHTRRTNTRALSQFSSLDSAFAASSSLVLLYFAAAWCPVSTPATENIEEYLSDHLAPPPPISIKSSTHTTRSATTTTKKYPLSLVYISSDKTKEAFDDYLGTNWMVVPWDSPERTQLKRHFRVCAKPEVQALGIDRTMEIPTLLILDSVTHAVVTTGGVQDLKEYEDRALDHWLDLHNRMQYKATTTTTWR